MQYTKQNPLRCFYAFAGYNSQKMALQRLADNFPGFHHVCVGWSEIDKNAIIANNAVFPEDTDKNFGDITKIDWAKVPGKEISKTAQYKLAGNSIVVSCMYHLFRKLFIEKENENLTLL